MSSETDDLRDRKTMPVPKAELFDGAGHPPLEDDDEPDTARQSGLPLHGSRGGDKRRTLVVLAGREAGSLYPLDQDEVLIGRGRGVDLRLEDPGVSRRHARIYRQGEGLLVEDAGSMNGTLVDGKRLEGAAPLSHGQRLQIGASLLQFALQDPVETEVAQRLYESSVRDSLTGVYNRRHLQERLRAELSFARRASTELSLLMLDIDHFKKVNDEEGHLAGDAVLKAIAALIGEQVRTEDLVARFGGEEFVVLLRTIDREGALTLAERIRAAVEELRVAWEGKPLSVTASIGVATHGPHWPFADEESLLAAADQALYASKQAGRNRVSVHEPAG